MRIMRVVNMRSILPRARDLRFLELWPTTRTMGRPRVRIEGHYKMRSGDMVA